jgi:hypothetical protein
METSDDSTMKQWDIRSTLSPVSSIYCESPLNGFTISDHGTVAVLHVAKRGTQVWNLHEKNKVKNNFQ